LVCCGEQNLATLLQNESDRLQFVHSLQRAGFLVQSLPFDRSVRNSFFATSRNASKFFGQNEETRNLTTYAGRQNSPKNFKGIPGANFKPNEG
jgi:hypothetical protein